MVDQSSNDKLIDLYIERAVDLLRLESGTRDKVLSILNDLEGELVAALAKSNPTGNSSKSVQQNRLQGLLKNVQSAIRASYRGASVLMASEIRDIVDQESTWAGHAINESIGINFVTDGLTRKSLEQVSSNVMIHGAASADWWSRQAQDLQNRFADETRKGMALGETNDQLVKRIRGSKDQKGLMDISRSSANRLVRTSVQAAANDGREATYKENSDIIEGLQWHATLDTRTSIWCITRDGHLYENDDKHEAQDDGPAWLQGPGKIHWQCRSTSIPKLKSWRSMGIDLDEVPQTTRSSMDGQVAASTTFEDWLGKQSQERQDAVLGPEKADLWRRGKITFKDLLDQSGRPLTTEQLRQKTAQRAEASPAQPTLKSRPKKITAPEAAAKTYPWKSQSPADISDDDITFGSRDVLKPGKSMGVFSNKKDAIEFSKQFFSGLPRDKPLSVNWTTTGQNNNITVEATSEGNSVSMTRVFRKTADGKLSVDHSHFVLDDEYQGKGFATKSLQASVEAYDKLGIDTIALHANLDVGGYAWAKMGFKARGDTTQVREELVDLAHSIDDEADRKNMLKIIVKSSDDDLMYNVATAPGGKQTLLGSSWNGEMNLKDVKQRARFIEALTPKTGKAPVVKIKKIEPPVIINRLAQRQQERDQLAALSKAIEKAAKAEAKAAAKLVKDQAKAAAKAAAKVEKDKAKATAKAVKDAAKAAEKAAKDQQKATDKAARAAAKAAEKAAKAEAKTIAKTTKSNSAKTKKITAKPIASKLVTPKAPRKIEQQTDASKDADKAIVVFPGVKSSRVKELHEDYETLPQSVRDLLRGKNSTVKVAPLLRDMDPTFIGQPRGWPQGSSYDNVAGVYQEGDAIYISTSPIDFLSGKQVVETELRRRGTFFHEIGHAFDYHKGGRGNLSATAKFTEAYRQDVADISFEMRQTIGYYLQSGDAGPSEAFAEIFNNVVSDRACNGTTTLIKGMFPRFTKLVKESLAI